MKLTTLRLVVLFFGLTLAAVTDVRTGKLPNRLTVPMAAVGLALGACGGLTGLWFSGAGLVCGFAVGFVLWLLGVFRAGDSKLLCAMGAFLGWRRLLLSFCWALMCGTVLGVFVLLKKRALRERAVRLRDYFRSLVLRRSFAVYEAAPGSERELPFSVPLLLGTLLTLAFSCAIK